MRWKVIVKSEIHINSAKPNQKKHTYRGGGGERKSMIVS